MRRLSDDAGYASVTAIVICAALSMLCAGVLSLVMTQKKQAERALFRAQQDEAINTAILRLGADITRAQGDATIVRDESIVVPGGTIKVALRAEYEGRKWPLAKIAEVDESALAKYTAIPKSEFLRVYTQHSDDGIAPQFDCLRSLFSKYGYASPDKPLPEGTGIISVSAGHDGQVWRIRASNGSRLQERLVRFLGDPHHLFAVIAEEDISVPVMPNCAASVTTVQTHG
ncbi:hypothetical protein MMA231_04026 (plasmid) [Asticcacaulis sp. MM231]|uniref:hypothetical protein n=1 Tax=Asticcacaulis sp. MM231 TaxID=3157666 RepID=UPI0032D5AC06